MGTIKIKLNNFQSIDVAESKIEKLCKIYSITQEQAEGLYVLYYLSIYKQIPIHLSCLFNGQHQAPFISRNITGTTGEMSLGEYNIFDAVRQVSYSIPFRTLKPDTWDDDIIYVLDGCKKSK